MSTPGDIGIRRYSPDYERDELSAQNAEAYGYAKRFLEAFVAEHFPPNPDWKPLPDLMGVLTQIDNASTIARALRAENAKLREAVEEAADIIIALKAAGHKQGSGV